MAEVSGGEICGWKGVTAVEGYDFRIRYDRLLEHSLHEELYELCLKEQFRDAAADCATEIREVVLSEDELNVIRYVSGYVARQCLRKYEKKVKSTKVKDPKLELYEQYIVCLGEMAVEGEGGDVLEYTRKWIDKINRGGLFPVNNNSFDLFTEVEKCVRVYLPKYLKKKSGKDLFYNSVHEKVIASEDVQFYWTLLSQDVDDPDGSINLLTDIVKLWVTIRGHSMVATVYKSTEKTNIVKSTGFRKSISGTSN